MGKVRVLKENEKVNEQKTIIINVENKYKVAFEIDKDLIAQKVLINFREEFKDTKLINFEDFLQKYTYQLSYMLTENIKSAVLILFNIYDNPNLSIYKIVDNINNAKTDIETFCVSMRNVEIMMEMITLYKEYLEKN